MGPGNIAGRPWPDLMVRETDAYLLALANETVADVRQGNPSTSVDVLEGPSLRTIGGHAAVAFKLQYGTGEYFQKVAIVASEPHGRYWVLVLTTDGQSYPVMDEGFERMLSGFVITRTPLTREPGPTGIPWAILAIGGGSIAALLFAVLVVSFCPVPVRPKKDHIQRRFHGNRGRPRRHPAP